MAKSTEELNVKITGNSARAKTALDKTKKAIGGVGDKAKKQNSLLKNFKQNWMGITAATAGLVIITKKLVSAYAIQEKAQRTLSAAMKQAGTFTEAAFQHNLEYASSLQKMTTFGDEAILGVQKMLANFGVEGEMMDKLTEQTLNLAAAKGMDLKAAADLVAKSVGSSTNALTRYGIQVEGTVGSTERMQTAVENIAAIFGGAAVAEADTFAGSVEQLKNVFGDFMESIGETIAKFLKPLIGIFKTVVLVLDKMPESLKILAISLIATFTAGIVAAKLFGVTLGIATGGISLLIGAAVAGAILMVTHWEQVQFAFDVAWSAIKIGLLEAAAFMLEYIPIMFQPWFFVIDKVIESLNLFREEKLKTLTAMTADVKASADVQLAIEKNNLDAMIAAHKAATTLRKGELDKQDADVKASLGKQLMTFTSSLKETMAKVFEANKLMRESSAMLVDAVLDNVTTMKSNSKAVFAAIARGFGDMIVGKFKTIAKEQAALGAIALLPGPPSALTAPGHFAAAGLATAAAATAKALSGSMAASIMSAAGGADFVASSPQLMMVGDATVPEHVKVTPEGQGEGGINISIGNLTVMSNNVEDMTDQIFEKAELAGAKLFRRGAFA